MPDIKCHPDYLPWLLAHDMGFQPCPDTYSETWELGSNTYVVSLCNETHKTNVIIKYDNDWDT